MCIIIYKPAGRKLPNEFMRFKCEVSNPDGFGFATPTKVFHSMHRDELEYHLRRDVDIDEPCFIHCRIATHGSLKKSNCHPFVDLESGVSFAHNGILHKVEPIGDKTDSETAFLTHFVPVIRRYGINSRELAAEVRSIIDGSRFIFMNPEGEVVMFGNWYKREQDGCYYSHIPW
jgi:hypothetical protein